MLGKRVSPFAIQNNNKLYQRNLKDLLVAIGATKKPSRTNIETHLQYS
ncbi:hypothetical protein RO3G_15834 [Rhizopus delemar RA 99-880]|uniref:Uncharacterized protein n=1 Tax=Rhizopus delemar (strain RA 99-880 / ATCC MYA-4621 / FGSC 9543 / NRRL 43880) TaxID=246409 RepID=I1CRP3_RHIO9|nr:hypothetical protein RO3G_15834 [Rhizopus delemar RA 99-880]|eukprot:EIE91123.1 hypothetical protein RO3G_15834 [Rhizopus delemar RA 99-880]